jgi:hypothetical protein
MPDEGGLMFDTHISMKGDTSGASNKVYTFMETVSYNMSNRLQLGGYIGYRRLDALGNNNLTNPGFFGIYRLLDNLVKIDGGAGAEFNIFDDYDEGGVSDGANKFSIFARGAFDMGAASIGAFGGFSYWDGYGAKSITEKARRSAVNGDINFFAIFDIMDILGAGGEAGYKVYDMKRDAYHHGYYLTGRIDINPIPSKFGIQGYVTFENIQHIADAYIIGIKARFII